MFKKIFISVLCILLICGMAAVFYFVKQEEAQISKQLADVNEQIAPYQQEITELREKIDRIKLGKEDGETDPARVVYGYYASTPAEISDEGAIVLDADADWDLRNAAKATGREIIYFFAVGKQVPRDGAAVVLRLPNDIEENRRKITGVISRHMDSSSAGPMGDNLVNIPYIYNKNDNDQILERLNSCQGALLVIFNPEVKNNLALLKNCFENGLLVQSTVAETKQYLLENMVSEEKRAERNKAYILELEERIDELQQQIDGIYAESKAIRAMQKRALGSINR